MTELYDPDDDPELEELLREPVVPELERLGIFTGSRVDHRPAFAELAGKLRELYEGGHDHVDPYGYEWRVTALAVDEAAECAAWVEWQERDGRVVDVHYWLRARDRYGLAVSWEIETYNPYSGCRVHFLEWRGGAVVMVYSDKHDTFAAALERGAPVRRVTITPELAVAGGEVVYRANRPDEVDRLALPSLEPLPPMSAGEARRLGVLPPAYDEANALHKRLRGGG